MTATPPGRLPYCADHAHACPGPSGHRVGPERLCRYPECECDRDYPCGEPVPRDEAFVEAFE